MQPTNNKDLDEHFTDTYGKTEWFSLIGVNKSNWSKMVSGERNMPNIYRMFMEQGEELIRLKNVVHGISPDTKIEDLLSYLEAKESSEVESLRIENDKLKSKLRMVRKIDKLTKAILEK